MVSRHLTTRDVSAESILQFMGMLFSVCHAGIALLTIFYFQHQSRPYGPNSDIPEQNKAKSNGPHLFHMHLHGHSPIYSLLPF